MTEPLSHGQGSHQGPAQISPGLLHENHHNCRCRRLRHTKELLINLITRPEYDSLSLFLSLCVLRIIEILTYDAHSHSSIIINIISIIITLCASIDRTLNFECTRRSNLRWYWHLREREILHLEWVIVSAVQEFIGLGHPY